MREIKEIIIHCSATFPEQRVTVADITRWHRQLGWQTIGYHYVINQAGEVEEGRPVQEVGAHCKGHNTNSIGICYIGGLSIDGKPVDTRTDAQKDALLRLVRQLKEQHPNATVHGHNEFAAKACPCFDVRQWRKEVGV